jgi:molybdopterin-guanine dinucleotide biosynthesis protein A
MGRDKAALRLDGRTLVAHLRRVAREAGLSARVIRRDLVPRCGPLGGIFTALQTSRARAELFLACDMPFVTAPLLKKLVATFAAHPGRPVFCISTEGPGFPCLLPSARAADVARRMERGELSLRALAAAWKGKRVRPDDPHVLANINTPAEWRRAQQYWLSWKKRC